MENHAQRKHAILSASGAERWMNCTPSARLEAANGPRKQSKYADEGTVAHELGDLMLNRDALNNMSDIEYMQKLEEIMAKEAYNEDMLIEVPKYVEYCMQQYEEAKKITPDAIIAIEDKIDLQEYIPEGFGTDDCIIIADGVMEVIDLKYGKGVTVKAEKNKQLMLYGLGALQKYAFMYDVQTIKLTIVQPRMDNISSWDISYDDIIAWADDELRETAKIAFAGEGELNPGSWCKFCSVRNKCTKLAEENLELAKLEFAKPQLLSDDEVSMVLRKAQMLNDWVNSITEWALSEAVNHNKVWPGFKLVEGQSRRKWVDEAKAAHAIKVHFPGIEEDEMYNTKLKSITDIEKLVTKKKFAEKLNDVVIKPAGKPTLVPLTDNRPAFGLGQAISDFSD